MPIGARYAQRIDRNLNSRLLAWAICARRASRSHSALFSSSLQGILTNMVLLAFGGNMGDVQHAFRKALSLLAEAGFLAALFIITYCRSRSYSLTIFVQAPSSINSEITSVLWFSTCPSMKR